MARLIPDRVTPPVPQSERDVFRAFSTLPDEWAVLHSVSWQSHRDGRQGDGEADFVLVNPNRGMLVVEVKGGEIKIEQGEWYSIDSQSGRVHPVKNPFEQVTASKHTLVRYLKRSRPPLPRIPVCHAVAFPSIRVDDSLGPYGPRAIILDAQDLTDAEAAVKRVLDHWEQRASLDAEAVDRVVDMLAPTIQLRLAFRDSIERTRTELIQLTQRQIDAFRIVRRIRRALVLGPAGSGKTILAIERAKQLADDGFCVLLLCFNRLLAEYLKNSVANYSTIHASTFHALCVEAARAARVGVPDEPDANWWEKTAPNLLATVWTAESRSVDALVIDEGQDFRSAWLVTSTLLLDDPSDGPFYVFADSNQEIYERDWELPEPLETLLLDTNCRNTQQIGRQLALSTGAKCGLLEVNGPEPVFVCIDEGREPIETVQAVATELLESEGVQPTQITALCDRRDSVDRLRTMLAGDWSFTDSRGVGVTAETIQSFKGLESDIVILLLSDTWIDDPVYFRALAYVGLSRARSVLYVVGPENVRHALRWPA